MCFQLFAELCVCESIRRNDGGKLFHVDDPATENGRLPNLVFVHKIWLLLSGGGRSQSTSTRIISGSKLNEVTEMDSDGEK